MSLLIVPAYSIQQMYTITTAKILDAIGVNVCRVSNTQNVYII